MIKIKPNASKVLVLDIYIHISHKTSIHDTKSWDNLLHFPCLWKNNFWNNLKGSCLDNFIDNQVNSSKPLCTVVTTQKYPLDIAKHPEVGEQGKVSPAIK